MNEKRYKIRSRKWCKIRPGKLCKRKQTQSISAMNSQSSINWVKLLQSLAENCCKARPKNCCKVRPRKVRPRKVRPRKVRPREFVVKYGREILFYVIGKRLENLNLWSVKKHPTEASTLWDASANVDRDHVFCRSDVDGVLSLKTTRIDELY